MLTDLQGRGIGVAVNFRAVHLLKDYRETFGFARGRFPCAERIGDATILEGGRPPATWYEVYIKHPERWKAATLLRLDGVVARGAEAAAAPDLHQQYFKMQIEDRCDSRNVMVALKYSGAGIFRATDPSRLPLPVLSFALAPDWRGHPLRQRLLEYPAVTAAGTPVDPHPGDKRTLGSGWRRNAGPLAQMTPPLDAWEVLAGVTVTKRRDAYAVVGNTIPSGYQLMSPPLEVRPHQTLAVQIAGSVDQGEMCVGVLDGSQQAWLLSPRAERALILVDTGDYRQVRIVFSNCAHPSGAFTVRSVSYQTFPPEP